MNILGIDFEDWFHPELIQKHNTTNKNEPKVVEGIDKIIELLRKNETKATFFVVGELLEYKPELLDKILENENNTAKFITFPLISQDSLLSKNWYRKFTHVFQIPSHLP